MTFKFTYLRHCTCYIQSFFIHTPATISALPSSLHSATLAFICSRTSDLISPVSPVKTHSLLLFHGTPQRSSEESVHNKLSVNQR